MTGCDDPYIGDESTSRPPAAKKARITSADSCRPRGSLPTLNVIQVPRPTTGTCSPDDGMGLVSGAACAAGANPAAAAEPIRRRTVRRSILAA
jgi:hypothetical protein